MCNLFRLSTAVLSVRLATAAAVAAFGVVPAAARRRAQVERRGHQGDRRGRPECDPADPHGRDGPGRGPRRAECGQAALRRLLLRGARGRRRRRRTPRRRGHAHGAGRGDPDIRRARAAGRGARDGRGGLPGVPRRSRRGAGEAGRHGGRPGRRRSDAGAAQGRRRHARRALHAGQRPGPLAAAPEPRPAQPADQGSETRPGLRAHDPAGLGQRHAVRAAVGVAVLAARPPGAGQRRLCAGFQRDQGHRRPGQRGAHPRAGRDRPLLVRRPGRVVPVRPCGGRGPRTRRGTARARSPPCRSRWPTATSRASGSATSTTRGARSPRSAKRPTTATTPPLPTHRGTACRTRRRCRTTRRPRSIFSAAAAVALAAALGTDQVAVTVTSGPPFADIKRSYASLSQAARESADSRIYAGIHFRSACEDGLVLGRQIGQRVAASYLQPVRN